MSGRADAGRRILEESFALIERELGPHALPPWAFAVVRRLIHASADFDYARTLRYSADFEPAVRAALARGVAVVTDTEMVRIGIQAALARRPAVTVACHLNDAEASALAEAAGLTRSAAGMRLAARHHVAPLLAIGNAPTALDEALRLVEQEGWRPAGIVGIPVGFVGVEEAKRRLLGQSRVPYLTCVGRKGGSAVTAAALNALVEPDPTCMSDERERMWAQLQTLAERCLEHPKDLPPRDPIRLYGSLWRLWHYPVFAPQTTWTVLKPGRKAPSGAPALVREVRWDVTRDNQRIFGPDCGGGETDPCPSLRLRDAALPGEALQRLAEAGVALAVPLLTATRAADAEADTFGLETYEVSPFVRVQWRGAGPLAWRHFIDWVGELRAFCLHHLDEAK